MTERDQKQVQPPEHIDGVSLVDHKIASFRACGLKLKQIEALVGLDHTTISKRCRKTNVKALIENLSAKFAQETVGTILQAHKNAIEAGANALNLIRSIQDPSSPETILESAKLATATKDLIDTSDKMMKRAGQAMGLFPTPNPSVFIQNLFTGPANLVLGAQVSAMIGQASRELQEDDQDSDIVDIEL